jgi:predicted DNA-binding transcriptional regulator
MARPSLFLDQIKPHILSEYADKVFYAPDFYQFAFDLGFSKQAVNNSLGNMEREGLIERENKIGSRGSVGYHLTGVKVVKLTQEKRPKPVHRIEKEISNSPWLNIWPDLIVKESSGVVRKHKSDYDD